MKIKIIIIPFLFCTVVSQAMDQRAECSKKVETRNSNHLCLDDKHIAHLKPLKKLLDLKTSVSELPFAPELEPHMSNPLFPLFIRFLNKAVSISGNDVQTSEIMDKIIDAKNCSPQQLLILLKLVRYFEVDCLHRPLLMTITNVLVKSYIEGNKKTQQNFLAELTTEDQEAIKAILMHYYAEDVCINLADPSKFVQISKIVQRVQDGKYFVVQLPQITVVYDRKGILLHVLPIVQGHTTIFNHSYLISFDALKSKAVVHLLNTGELLREVNIPEETQGGSIRIYNNFMICSNKDVSRIQILKLDEPTSSWQTFENSETNTNNAHVSDVLIAVTPDETKMLLVNIKARIICVYDMCSQAKIYHYVCTTAPFSPVEYIKLPTIELTNNLLTISFENSRQRHPDQLISEKYTLEAQGKIQIKSLMCGVLRDRSNEFLPSHSGWVNRYYFQLHEKISRAKYGKQTEGATVKKTRIDLPGELHMVDETDDRSLIFFSRSEQDEIQYMLDMADILNQRSLEQVLVLIYGSANKK